MKRITFLIAVAFGLAISSASFAQTVVDVVYLKNGSVIRGTIVEQVPGESLKVQTANGSIFVYTRDEVEKTFCVIGLANAEEPRHHCISVGFVHNPPEITVNAYGHRLSAIFRALSRKRSIVRCKRPWLIS